MLRATGLVLTLMLVGLMVAFRATSDQRAERLLAGEARAHRQISALVRAARIELDAGAPHPGLAAVLHAGEGLRLLPELGGARVEFATDGAYLYGLAPTSTVADDGSARHGYVLRAWPREYGVTGDVEFHVRADGNLWIGQNQTGRSGVERGFPPPFPEPDLDDPDGPGARWWRRRLVGE